MTGIVGNLSLSSTVGGFCKVDATKVRWLPYNTGSGMVPAIGTTISQGGVTGYLLGVWVDAASAPTAVGATMPATGFLKLREVNNGAFSAGALTGISASATGPDVVGWIEVVGQTGSSLSPSAIGDGYQFRGGWFELGTTNGSRGQTFQVPTNGGGANTHVWGFQVETSAGSGIYEWWLTTTTAQAWTTANITTDSRSRVAESVGNGVIRIGSDGTNNIGYLPPSGCKVRIPNIFGRTAAFATAATNAAPGAITRYSIGPGSTSAFKFDCEYFHADWNASALSGLILFSLKYSAFENTVSITNNLLPSVLTSCALGGYTSTTNALTISTSTSGFTFTDVIAGSVGAGVGANQIINLVNSQNLTITNIQSVAMKLRTAATGYGIQFSNVSNVTVNGLKVKGLPLNIATASNLTVNNMDYVDRLSGAVTSSVAVSAVRCTVSKNVTIDGFTFGEGGTITDAQCYNAVFLTLLNTGTIKFRNAGTRSSMISSGTTSSLYPQYIWQSTGFETDIRLQKLYFTDTRTAAVLPSGNAKNCLIVNVYGGTASATINAPTSTIKGIGFNGSPSTASTSVDDTMWFDRFIDNTTGFVQVFMNRPTDKMVPYVTLSTASSTTSGFNFTTSAAVLLSSIGDYIIVEMPAFIKGHTGFQNTAPTITGQGQVNNNFTHSYQIDTGLGWNGTWKVLNGTNLSAETIDPATGFKLKLRTTLSSYTASAGELLNIKISTNTTLTAQVNNQYSLDTATLSFTGLQTGSEVRAYVGTDPSTAAEIGGIEETTGSTFSFTHSSGGQTGFIVIFAMGYQSIYIPSYIYPTSDTSLLIQQTIDRNYNNP